MTTLPAGYRITRRGTHLAEHTRRLLDWIVERGGFTRFEDVQEAFPALALRNKLPSLEERGYLRCVGHRMWLVTAQYRPDVPRRSPPGYVGEVVAPRSERYVPGPWTEPYLSDAGVRRSGLEFREHPSRRGDRFVYCYRREAAA